jgi:hypothetical protein
MDIDDMIGKNATKIIVAGGRDFDDYGRMAKVLNTNLEGIKELILVRGDCPTGADALVKVYAEECGIDLATFEADWDQYGDAAGPIRNSNMAQYGHALISFWDMKSPGTDSMIKQARKVGIPVMIIVY